MSARSFDAVAIVLCFDPSDPRLSGELVNDYLGLLPSKVLT